MRVTVLLPRLVTEMFQTVEGDPVGVVPTVYMSINDPCARVSFVTVLLS